MAVLVLSCKSKEAPAEQPVSPTPTLGVEELKALAGEAEAEAVKLRGITPDKPVRSEVTSKGAVEAYLVQRIEDTGAQRQLDTNAKALTTLGVLDPSVDLTATIKDFIREQVAGYYDWEKKTLYVADWLPAFLQRPTLVHEVTHALQDQKFGLARFMEPADGYSEPQAAVQALIEGDATLVMMDSMMGGVGTAGQDALQASLFKKLASQLEDLPGMEKVPPVLRESFFFPYVAGLGLAVEARARGGFGAVDALYARPPISTEQVMHPEKLLDEPRDNPREIRMKVPDEALAGYAVTGTDIVGELGLKAILAQSMDKDRAAEAAAGWDGDRFLLLEKPGAPSPLVLWASIWDSPDEAAQAEAALRSMGKPPVALLRKEPLIVAVWGEGLSAEQLSALIAGAIRGTKMHEVATLEAYQAETP